jgi:hypothetical protein
MFHVEHPRPSPNVRYRTLLASYPGERYAFLCSAMFHVEHPSGNTRLGMFDIEHFSRLGKLRISFMRLEMFHVEHLVVASSSRLAMGGVGLIPAASLHRHRQALDATFEICSTWNIRRIACNTKRKGESHQLSTTGTPAKHRIRQSWRGIHMFSTAATSSAQPSTVASRFSAR